MVEVQHMITGGKTYCNKCNLLIAPHAIGQRHFPHRDQHYHEECFKVVQRSPKWRAQFVVQSATDQRHG